MATPSAKVLLIEDDPLHAQVIEGLAAGDGWRFEIEVAESLEKGLARLAQGGPDNVDLILLDLLLPDSEGINTFAEIQKNFPSLPVVILTATGNEEILLDVIKAGAQDYLVKWELNSQLLQRSIRYAIERKRAEINLHEQQYAVRHLADALPEVVALFDLKDSRLVYGNEQAVRLFGRSITPSGLLDLRSIVHPDDVGALDSSFERLLENPKSSVSASEFRVRRGHGEWHWLDCRHIVYRREADGRPREILCTAHDITERKLAEAALHESQDRYRDLVENSGLFVGTHDPEGRILSANQSVLDFLGMKEADQLIGLRVSDFLPEKGRPLFPSYLNAVLSKGQAAGLVRFKSPTGQSIFVEYTNSLRRDVEGAPVIRCIGRDVTKRARAEAALRESEERLRLALTAAQMGAWEWNIATDCLIGDDYARGLLDVGSEGMAGVLERVHPDDCEFVRQKIQFALENNGLRSVQFRITDGEGRERWIESSASLRRPDPENAGQPQRVIGVIQDVTERKRFEESQLLLNSAVHYANDSILITTAQLDPPGPFIVFVNPAFSQMTGYSPEELIGKTPPFDWMLQGPKTDRDTLRQVREHLSRGESFSTEIINYRKDGSEYTVEWHLSPIRNLKNETTHFISIQHDVSARKKTEERLREQADLLDNATDAIVLLDLEEGITLWNRGAERLYGWTFDEVRGRRLKDVLYRETPARFEEAKQSLVSQGKWRGELTQITKDGREIMVESRWTLIRDEPGDPRSVFVINTDITEKKRLEAVVLRAQRLESIGALASGIAHDLNNVLAPILMALHTLQQRFRDDSSQRWLALMHKSAERGRDLIEQVLAFARGAEGERAPLQTANLIVDIARILKETLPKDIELQVQVPDDLWSVIGDTTQIHQILMNLCINARDAMPEGGRLLIRARNRYLVEEEKRLVTNPAQKQYVRLTVADTGVGIPPEIIDRIFDPFFTTKEKGKGSGLGLSTVNALVRGHGGFVHVASKVGRGTEFKVYLPARDAVAVEPVNADQVDLPVGKGEMILVVDDEADIREVTGKTLEDYGYRVVPARDGREAVEIYRQRRDEIELVVTDMVMPNLDGPATIRALKQINPNVRVIATSGVRSTGKLSEAMRLGVKTFLPKPYTAERLLTVVAESLNGSPGKKPRSSSAGQEVRTPGRR